MEKFELAVGLYEKFIEKLPVDVRIFSFTGLY